MKKKVILIGLMAFLLCGCGKVSKLKNGQDAVVSFEKNESISVDTLYDEMKDRYAISILIDMIDKEILYKEYEKKMEKFREIRWIPFKEMNQKQRIIYRRYLNTLKNEERKLL